MVVQTFQADLDTLADDEELAEHLQPLLVIMQRLYEWAAEPANLPAASSGDRRGGMHGKPGGRNGGGFESKIRMMQGAGAVTAMESIGIAKVTVPILKEHFDKITEIMKKDHEDPAAAAAAAARPDLEGSTTMVLRRLLVVLECFFGYTSDYRVVLERKAVRATDAFGGRKGRGGGGGGGRRRGSGGGGGAVGKTLETSLSFWCLNPAAGFGTLNALARTVVVTSGTLSPLDSFASELGTEFPVRMEAGHVIASSQVWISTISRGQCVCLQSR